MNRTLTRLFRSFADFDACTRDGAIEVRRGQGGAKLVHRVVVADEAGRTTPRATEHIGGRVMAKKQFLIADADVRAAVLSTIFVGVAPGTRITLRINGHRLSRRWPERQKYWRGQWLSLAVPVKWLKKGLNEVTYQTEHEAGCALLIEDSLQPRRSAKSIDGGQTWQHSDLGTTGAFRHGEYVARLELRRYAPAGAIASPPIDLALLAGSDGVAAAARVLGISLTTRQQAPPGTSIRLAVRFGPSPSYDPATWTAWQPAATRIHRLPSDARFLQWQATLATRRAQATPALKQVTISAEADVEEPGRRIALVRSDNPPIVCGSWHFAHQHFEEPRLALFRKKWNLDAVIDGAGTDFDQLVRLRDWTRRQWEDGWNSGPMKFVPPWDGFLILELASRQLSLGMCTHYAATFVHVCAALGFTARIQIMRAHCIVEVWSNHLRKWVAFDPGGDTNDRTKATYHIERDGVPLSALELHRACLSGDFGSLKFSPPRVADLMKIEDRVTAFERFCIHRRNDELSSLEPSELEHGATSYHYDEYLWWTDARTRPLPWFSLHSSREGDYHWTLNHAQIHLQRTRQPMQLRVQLDTVTPNLEMIAARRDGGAWRACEACFDWDLHPGMNALEVRPRNKFGRDGIVTSVAVQA